MATKFPIRINLEFDEALIKHVVGKGEALLFVDRLAKAAAEQIQVEVANHLARGARGGLVVGFELDDKYGTGPRPRLIPWPKGSLLSEQLRVIVKDELKAKGLGR